MQNEKNNPWKNFINILLIISVSICVCMLIYKAQVEWDNDVRIKYTLMPTHKSNQSVVLSKENPVMVEDFVSNVSELKKIQIEGCLEDVADGDTLTVEVLGLDSGESYLSKTGDVKNFFGTKTGKKMFKLKGLPQNTEGLMLRLIVTLETESDTNLIMTAGSKQGTVLSFNGNGMDRTNVIYAIKYGSVRCLSGLFAFLCIWLTLTILITYYLLFVKKLGIEKWFPIVGILLGIAIEWVIPVNGVPDESWHMDTAYQLSDTIMNVDKEPQNGTVIKRECDVITTDLLANDVEPNSYYQEWVNTFKKPEKTDLIRVAYVDSGNQVPDIVYLPAAIGISIGRICGLSGMMTYKLGRIFPLVFYIMLVWLAVSVLPFCNSMTGMTGLSLIALQQASSASYDAIINGVIILFVSLCVALAYGNVGKKNKLYIFLTLLAALLIVTVKGGVYIPVLMLLILPVERSAKAGNSLLKTKYIIGGSCAVIVACLLVFRRFYALLNTILSTGDVRGGDGYTLSYAFKHPALIVYIFVRTIFNKGEVCIRGMFGGMLGWHNISVSWIFIMPLCCGMFLLIHSENERPPAKKSFKAVCIAVTFITTILIMLAMLFSETKIGKPNIWGLQGRYLIPVEAVLLMALSTSMITVNHNQKQKIIFAMLTIQAVAMLEIVALII